MGAIGIASASAANKSQAGESFSRPGVGVDTEVSAKGCLGCAERPRRCRKVKHRPSRPYLLSSSLSARWTKKGDRMYQPVVVTGASRGIGRALALAFARRKHDLVLCARWADREGVGDEARGLGVEGAAVRCNLATVEGGGVLVRAMDGSVGGLVNNAGFGTGGEFARQDPEREREM